MIREQWTVVPFPTKVTQSPPLTTPRLVLRELEDSDFDAVHAYATDPLVVRYMPWGPNTEADTIDFLTRSREAAQSRPRLGYELAVVVAESGTLVGAIGLHRTDASTPDAMLGYCFARTAWGHGFATEAAREMLRFGFKSLELECVWAGCDADNHASIRVLEKIGMTLESRHREKGQAEGQGSESLMFGIRSADWSISQRAPR